MSNDQATDKQKVLVELSVVSMGDNGKVRDRVGEVLKIADKAGLFFVRTNHGTCIEGEWTEISPLIQACYERVQADSPTSFLQVYIR
jgi:uncharacterized protein YqgV (UPF0045/DUF77 family)